MLDILGVIVNDEKTDFGVKYTFLDGDNEIILGVTELTMDEVAYYSEAVRDYEVYMMMKPYPVETVIGFDWEIKTGKDELNIRKVFRTMEILGKRYAKLYDPDIIYYAYEDVRVHRHYKKWIKEGGYKMIHEKKIAMYYKESKK